MGEYDAVLIVDLPNLESMAGLALAVAAGGSIKTSKITPLISGDEGVQALRNATTVAKTYQADR
jgi:uncharacterized protein with GYD domain